MRYNGKAVIGLGVVMAPGGNVQKLGAALDKTMEEVEAGLPVGITGHQASPSSPSVVTKSFQSSVHSLIEALAIVLAVSFVSLGLRSGIDRGRSACRWCWRSPSSRMLR